MKVEGYILLNGEKWRVSVENRRRDLALTKRSGGEDGVHLEDVQAFLKLPEHRWLIDPLRYGVTVYLPMYSLSAQLAVGSS